MSSQITDAEAIESEFEVIDDIVCYECRQMMFSACIYLAGECPLDLL